MSYDELDSRSKDYVNSYCRNKGMTREETMELAIVKEVLASYKEKPNSNDYTKMIYGL